MISFPNCKINIGLYITQKRQDGYHNIETIFYPVPLRDALEIHPLSIKDDDDCKLYCYGNKIKGENKENIIIKAYQILQQDYKIPSVNVSLYKHIPTEAGLGGGSADATCMLKLLNNQFKLNLSNRQLESYAKKLGADCAFFVQNTPLYAYGIGNIFTSTALSLKGYRIIIVKPNIAISTKEAFAHVIPHKPKFNIKEINNIPLTDWKYQLENDFEKSLFLKYPELSNIKDKLYQLGALYASMTGSGAAIFGIFPQNISPNSSSFNGMFYFNSILT